MSTRREFIKSGGALIVGFSLGEKADLKVGLYDQPGYAQAPGAVAAGNRSLDLKQVDTWLAIHADNTATVYIGFAELGQGASTALLQVAGEELDLSMSQMKTVPLDTTMTPNQGGTYSSAAINRGSPQVRNAAAEARQALLQLASERLGASVDRLTVSRGVVTVAGDPQRSVTYGALLGDKRFNMTVSGNAPLKAARDYRLAGTSPRRNDMPDKVNGRYVYMQHVRLPGMLHARVIRPAGQPAHGMTPKAVNVDETSIRGIPARVLRRGDFIGVVAEREWDAIRAARELKVTWEITPALPGNARLHERMKSEPTQDRIVLERGNVAAAFATATHVATQVGRGPYQSHAAFGPNCAVADVRADSALIVSPTQDLYATRTMLTRMLGLPADKVQVRYQEGASNYGHGCQDDVTQAAALLSQLASAPVRVQFTRADEHGWDNYGPAHLGDVRAAADSQGRIVAYEYHGWQHNWFNVEPSAQLAGTAPAEREGSAAQQVSPLNLGSMYDAANVKLVNHRVPAMGYLRGAWLRSPLDLSFSFASEQAIDQLAFLLELDPLEFRRRNITDARWLGVLNAAAEAARWQPRRAAAKVSTDRRVRGRGIAVGTHLASYGGAVAEIELDRQTGRVAITHLYGALDAGFAVNPGNIENQISGQLIQTASRLLKEEVLFDIRQVTSLDWNSYPIARFEDAPAVTPIVVQRVNERSTGAGEEVMAAAAAAIANAFFDATGVRMEEYPLTPARVLAALKRAADLVRSAGRA
jgi:nicotinate dehydrogenase subunit B